MQVQLFNVQRPAFSSKMSREDDLSIPKDWAVVHPGGQEVAVEGREAATTRGSSPADDVFFAQWRTHGGRFADSRGHAPI